jgi:polyhydroxybutyrate depolymerase
LVALVGLPLAAVAVALCAYAAMDRTNGQIVSSGEVRRYLVYAPPSYDPARAAPLVISLHGGAMWPTNHRWLTHWNELADEAGFIVVYPQGRGQPRHWRIGTEPGADDDAALDAAFISDLIDALEAEYNIDPSRIYANGFSNGGGMTFVLSCELSDRIAAVGLVGAAHFVPWDWCEDPRPTPMIAFHGEADAMAPYGGGPTALFDVPFPSIADWTGNWAARNRCGGEPVRSRISPHVRRTAYTDCAGDAAVALYTIEGGGHQWPGGRTIGKRMLGPNTDEIDATAVMWDFFRRHPARQRQTPGTQ